MLREQGRGEEEGDKERAEPPAAGGDEGGAEEGCGDRPAGIEQVTPPGSGGDRDRREERDSEVAGGDGERIQVRGSGEGRVGGDGWRC
jgi:hypothetical protein